MKERISLLISENLVKELEKNAPDGDVSAFIESMLIDKFGEPGFVTIEEAMSTHCLGCEDDFYNDKNPLGVKRCWHLEGAELKLRKKVHINQMPPWEQKPEMYLDCYRQKEYIFVNGDKEF